MKKGLKANHSSDTCITYIAPPCLYNSCRNLAAAAVANFQFQMLRMKEISTLSLQGHNCIIFNVTPWHSAAAAPSKFGIKDSRFFFLQPRKISHAEDNFHFIPVQKIGVIFHIISCHLTIISSIVSDYVKDFSKG